MQLKSEVVTSASEWQTATVGSGRLVGFDTVDNREVATVSRGLLGY
jgi:hypothetical protein